MIIQTLVYIYGFILLLSSIFTFFLYLSYKEQLLKHLLFFWISGLVSFILQGAFNNTNVSGFLAFATHALSIFLLLKIYYGLSERKLPIRLYSAILALGLFASLVSFSTDIGFAISSGFFCASIFLIFIKSIFQNTNSKSDPLIKGLSLLLLLNAFHFADYPFIRPNPDMAVFGFSVALGFYFIYSIYIPLFIIKKTSDKYSMSLEKQVLARTSELNQANELLSLTNSELSSSNKSLEVVTKENQMLLSILVHDISNPIQIIMAFVDKSIAGEIDKLPKNFGLKTKSAVGSIVEMLTTVKNYHSARLGKLTPTISEFDVLEVINSVADQFEEKLSAKKLDLEINVRPGTATIIHSDRAWLKNQIFSNILSNAIKFSFVGSPIQIEIEDSQIGLSIRFRDYGPGIPSDSKLKVFSPNTSTSSYGTLGEKGTGLGMPIVKEYLTRLDGSVNINELPTSERGTLIEVVLPHTQTEAKSQVA